MFNTVAKGIESKGLDYFIENPDKLKSANPTKLYDYLNKNGYNPQPLCKGSLKAISYKDGGGYKVTWGGDKLLQYHPSGLNHHDGLEYWKFSSGNSGPVRYDSNGIKF